MLGPWLSLRWAEKGRPSVGRFKSWGMGMSEAQLDPQQRTIGTASTDQSWAGGFILNKEGGNMPKTTTQTSLTVRVDQEHMAWLDDMSLKDRRTRSELVRMLIEHCMTTVDHPRDLQTHHLI